MADETFYILHGEDDFAIDEQVAQWRAAMGTDSAADLNITEFDGTQTPVPEILGAALAFPFLADKRLVIVRDLLAWITRKGAGETGQRAVEMLLDQLPDLPAWTRLVFVERVALRANGKLVKLAKEHAAGCEKLFNAPKDNTPWIMQRAKTVYGVQIEPQAATALASVTVGDLRRADNELVKLVSYVAGVRPITEADVALLTPYVAEANIFKLVDALAEGRGQQAAALLHNLLDQQGDGEIFSLFGMITRQFRLLLQAKAHLSSGGAPKEIAAVLSVHPFVAEKLAKQTRAFDLAALERIYRVLHEYDVQIKTGRIAPRLALDLLIAGLSR
ncbi:MAG: DNA polymerase III subunit delta [Chloroflexi bacterium]|nr:DNA polymerase III subunit delta [Chloroflexota bacterium]